MQNYGMFCKNKGIKGGFFVKQIMWIASCLWMSLVLLVFFVPAKLLDWFACKPGKPTQDTGC